MMDSSEKTSPFLILPTEVFLHICSYLDAKCLAQSVRFVCKKFYSILGDPSIWKRRISRKLKNKFPPLPVDEAEFNWLKFCCSVDGYDRWKISEEKKYIERIHKAEDVCAVLLLNSGSICVTGSSQESITIWSIKCDPDPLIDVHGFKFDAHKDTVFSLRGKNNKLWSCSWDKTVKYWDISVGIQEVDVANCRTPVIEIATTDESTVLAAGTFSGEIEIFDVRTKLKYCKNYRSRKSAISSLAIIGNTLISANEAGFITAWDMRKDKILTKINIKKRTSGIVRSLSYEDNFLYASDSRGNLHLLHPKEIKLVETYNLFKFDEIYIMKYTQGCIFASFEDMFCVMSPTSPPQLIRLYQPSWSF